MKNTTLILNQIRLLMLNVTVIGNLNISSYIVPSSDSHHNIRRADCDQRLAYVSGFDGSAGTAIITQSSAALWTDARYFIQAVEQIDDNWTLMKEGLEATPTQSEWLIQNLLSGSIVGVDPSLYSKHEWDAMERNLDSGNITIVPIKENLIDIAWDLDRRKRPTNSVFILGPDVSGQSVEDKLQAVRDEMITANAQTLVISEMDEIAWLLNLRGSDLPLTPTFFSFAILTATNVILCIDIEKLNLTVLEYLTDVTGEGIYFNSYENVGESLSEIIMQTSGKVWLSKNCNYHLVSLVPIHRQLVKLTPIAVKKAIKNQVEINGIRHALIRDAATLCEFYYWLESAMNQGQNVTEITAADKLLQLKESNDNFVSLSFKTISGSGKNGAIIHYFPTIESNRKLSKDEMYLIDSGSHYL